VANRVFARLADLEGGKGWRFVVARLTVISGLGLGQDGA
jgi:hypothetical protein